MNKWEHIRRRAREFHEEASGYADSSIGASDETTEITASRLIENAARVLGVKIKGLPAKHPLLRKAVARAEGDKIYYNQDVEQWLALYNQAHELVFSQDLIGG